MKKVWVLSLLLLGACSAQKDDRTVFIDSVRSMNLYWVASPGTKFEMSENGEFTDPLNSKVVYRFDSIISYTSAYYKFDNIYMDGSTQETLISVFIGRENLGSARGLALGGLLTAGSPPPVSTTNSTKPEDIAAWKAYHKQIFVKENLSTTRGNMFAVVK